MPQLDAATFLPQLFWLAIAFGVLYLIVSRLALPRVGEVLQARSERIEADLARAEELGREAEAAQTAYEQAMETVRNDAHRLTTDAAQAAAAEAEQQHAALTARLDDEEKQAEERITAATARARAELQDHVADLVRHASIKVAGINPPQSAIAATLAGE